METIEQTQAELMTDREVAAYARLSQKFGYISVQKWARLGLLKGTNKTGRWLFHKKDVDDFLFPR